MLCFYAVFFSSRCQSSIGKPFCLYSARPHVSFPFGEIFFGTSSKTSGFPLLCRKDFHPFALVRPPGPTPHFQRQNNSSKNPSNLAYQQWSDRKLSVAIHP